MSVVGLFNDILYLPSDGEVYHSPIASGHFQSVIESPSGAGGGGVAESLVCATPTDGLRGRVSGPMRACNVSAEFNW